MENSCIVARWPFAFIRKSLEVVLTRLKEVLRTSSGRRLDDVLKKGLCNFHYRPIQDAFETKIKAFLRRYCDIFVSAGSILLFRILWITWSWVARLIISFRQLLLYSSFPLTTLKMAVPFVFLELLQLKITQFVRGKI